MSRERVAAFGRMPNGSETLLVEDLRIRGVDTSRVKCRPRARVLEVRRQTRGCSCQTPVLEGSFNVVEVVIHLGCIFKGTIRFFRKKKRKISPLHVKT